MIKKITNPPLSENLFKAAQSQGAYTLAAALADLIDNSISAAANEIFIEVPISQSPDELTVVISDNGQGMTRDELIEAMRPASRNPSSLRDENDLGRFGWGLKSASLSQAERLEVLTQKNGERSFASWDLADCHNFEMELDDRSKQDPVFSYSNQSSWTEVYWKKCTRLTEGAALNQRELTDKVYAAIQDLELIFHRYLEGENNLNTVVITINGRQLKPLDPFLRSKSTVLTDPTPITFRGGIFSYQAFALPRLNVMSDEEFNRLSGDEGLVKRQGFYVYRNKRLIISGTWFNIEPFRPLNQLIRIKLDIPNSMDDIWRITVDKSDAQLPQDLKRYLKDIVRSLRQHSTKKLTPRVFKRKTNDDSFWRLTRKAGIKMLEINTAAEIFNKDVYTREEVLALTNLLQASIPIDLIISNNSDTFTQVEPERQSTRTIYEQTLNLLTSVKAQWTEEALINAAMRYMLMPGDEDMIEALAREKYLEISHD